MPKMLLVPMYVDALCLDKEQTVATSTANFENLPYNNGTEDFFYEKPFISEEFLNTPFQDLTHRLPGGVHVHWALPASLTTGESSQQNTSKSDDVNKDLEFRDVPDRWLVIRSKDGNHRDKAWIVESNYLYPQNITEVPDAITFPLPKVEKDQPFRYMGRAYSLDSVLTSNINQKDFAGTIYYNHLTALGHGDPTFAAFYPNCHSVFGFYDKEITTTDNCLNLRYEVFGWYSDNQLDPLKKLQQTNAMLTTDDLLDHFNWKVDNFDNSCAGIMCYGTVQKSGFVSRKDSTSTPDLSVVVGNSGIEALMTYLNLKNATYKKDLEKLLYIRTGDSMQLDEDKRISQAMHTKGFSPVDGGSIWTMKITNAKVSDPSNKIILKDEIFTLPRSYAVKIDEINDLQQKSDRRTDIVRSQNQQLFTDWYKYMVSNYHNDLQKQLPDADLIRDFIEEEIKKNQAANDADQSKTQLDEKRRDLDQLINNFNNNSKNVSDKIDFTGKEPQTANITVANDATLAGVPVAVFDGKSEGFIYHATGTVAAISAWMHVSKDQPNDDGILMEMQEGSNEKFEISYKTLHSFTGTCYINALPINPEVPLSIASMPKDQWLHIYLQPFIAFNSPTVRFFTALKGKLAAFRCHNKQLNEDERFCDLNMVGLKRMEFTDGKAARFWQPNEPVILISGEDVQPGGRDTVPRQLDCNIYNFNYNDFRALVNDFLNLPTNFPGITNLVSCDTKWNPAILQWQVKLEDHLEFTTPYSQSIDSNYIINNFSLDKGIGDLTINKPLDSTTDNYKTYTGSTMLSDHAKTQMQFLIANSLLSMTDADIKKLLANVSVEQLAQISDLRERWKKQNITPLIPAFFTDDLPTSFAFLSATLPLLGTLEELNSAHFLSQTIGGFNAALLQLHQSPQFPIKEPVGFAETQLLTTEVKNNLKGEIKYAPLPLNPFNPIRTGALRIRQLSILDNFGQIVNVDTRGKVSFSEIFTASSDQDAAFLPPRIVQPARLNFRWLSAANEHANELEMNHHPASTPVCGLLVTNNLDHSIMVYDADGKMLGIIQSVANSKSQWMAIPGEEETTVFHDVTNAHLCNVVHHLLVRPADEFEDFIELLEETMDQIDPANFAQHTDLAMLISKPIAVVRCSLKLDVKGEPVVNQGWDYFDADLESTKRTTNNWEHVQFPVFLGEPGMLNDGVLGYWNDAETNGTFKSVHTYKGENENTTWFEAHSNGADPILLSVADKEPQIFTMLIDPRGLVHAVSGILPPKSISLPAKQFKPAIEKMSAVFFTRPLLMPANDIVITLPDEAGYIWSWLSKKGGALQELFTIGIADKKDFIKAFDKDAESIWKDMLAKGWITSPQNNKAIINPSSVRAKADANSPLQANEVRVTDMLNSKHIIPMEGKENFWPAMEAREGWLKLTVND